jgi:hypothetical protein
MDGYPKQQCAIAVPTSGYYTTLSRKTEFKIPQNGYSFIVVGYKSQESENASKRLFAIKFVGFKGRL